MSERAEGAAGSVARGLGLGAHWARVCGCTHTPIHTRSEHTHAPPFPLPRLQGARPGADPRYGCAVR